MSPNNNFNPENGVKKIEMVVGYEDLPDCAFCNDEYESQACFVCPSYDGDLEELTKKLELGRSDPTERSFFLPDGAVEEHTKKLKLGRSDPHE